MTWGKHLCRCCCQVSALPDFSDWSRKWWCFAYSPISSFLVRLQARAWHRNVWQGAAWLVETCSASPGSHPFASLRGWTSPGWGGWISTGQGKIAQDSFQHVPAMTCRIIFLKINPAGDSAENSFLKTAGEIGHFISVTKSLGCCSFQQFQFKLELLRPTQWWAAVPLPLLS